MIYGLDELLRTFGIDVLERARVWVLRGAVEMIPVVPNSPLLLGIVRTTGERPIRATARIGHWQDGSVSLSGNCSCPEREACEHIAAVLLAPLGDAVLQDDIWQVAVTRYAQPPTLEHQRAEAPSSWLARRQARIEAQQVDSWLGRFLSVVRSSQQSRPGSGGPSKYRLLYVLSREPYRRRLTVHPVVVYLRKGGRYGAMKNCGYTGGRRPAYVTLDDRELLAAIVAHADGSWGGTSFHAPVAIDPDAGSSLLERLLATGYCHWQTPDAPVLRAGERRSGTIEWQLEPEGVQRAGVVVDGCPDAIALITEPPWYVDPAEGVCGPLDLNVEQRTAAALLEAPDLSSESASRVREALIRAGGDKLSLPTPASVDVEQRVVVPRPHLRMTVYRPRSAFGDRARPEPMEIPMAMLTFDYNGLRVAPGDGRESVQQIVDGTLIQMVRDMDRERDAVIQLEEIGFADLDVLGFPYAHQDQLPGAFLPDGNVDIQTFLLQFARQEVPLLREAGWVVEFDDDYPFRVIEGESRWYGNITEGGNTWFDLELGVEIDGEQHSLLPILVELLRRPGVDLARWEADDSPDPGELCLRMGDGRILVLPGTRVRAILRTLTELFGERPLNAEGALPLSSLNAPLLDELDEALGKETLAWSGGEAAREFSRKLRDFREMKNVEVPQTFRGTLRPYQRDGLNWLQFLREHELAGILADDMGLGKTVQILAHLLVEKGDGRAERPSMVVAPTSVIANWSREAERFAPDLRVLVLQGLSRKERFERIPDHDLVLTTYPLLSRDEEALCAHGYHALILDEAQFVKNAKTKASLVARRIEAHHRLALTGTPMENHLGELWGLYHILMPGLLGDTRQFRKLFRTPIEKHGDRSRSEKLAARVRPFLLRRTKDEIASELPPKTEIVRSIELGRSQRDLYESIRLAMHDKVRAEVARKGLERSTIIILDALLKLRQVCCDPRLLKIEQAKQVKETAKLDALMEMLGEMLEEGRRILLFSQFTSMLKLIEQELAKREIPWVTITGNTRDRAEPVRRFQAGEVPLFLISLKAGGTGLNLTAADTVIHYDPWWNPAVEDQATDRAHRIGQDKPVFAYRLIVTGSVEEKMLALQSRKRELAEGIYGAGGLTGGAPLSADDLSMLFQPLDDITIEAGARSTRASGSRRRSVATSATSAPSTSRPKRAHPSGPER